MPLIISQQFEEIKENYKKEEKMKIITTLKCDF